MCSDELCAAAVADIESESLNTSQLDNSNDMTIYVGLLALLVLLIIVTLSTVILLYRSRRSSGKPGHYGDCNVTIVIAFIYLFEHFNV